MTAAKKQKRRFCNIYSYKDVRDYVWLHRYIHDTDMRGQGLRIREICCTYLVLKCVESKSTSNGKLVSYIEDKGKLFAHEHLAFFPCPCKAGINLASRQRTASICPSVLTDFTQRSSWWNEILFGRSWPEEACSNLWQFTSREDSPLGSDKKRHLTVQVLNRCKSVFPTETSRSLHRGVILIHYL